jgi:hypothetical protein
MKKINKLIEIIKELVKQELEEISTTASAGGQYMTPHAFSKKKLKKKKAGYGGGHEDPKIGGSYILAKDSKLRGGAVGMGGITHHKKLNRPTGKLNESIKMHTITGNKRFMTKTALPILRKYGAKNIKVNLVAGDYLEVRFPIDSRKLKKLDKELKRKNKTAYGGIVEGRYHQWRNDDTKTPKQKIGIAMRETRDSLNELERVVNYNVKLKNEMKVDSRDYWKNTHKALGKISERLVRLANKVGQLH